MKPGQQSPGRTSGKETRDSGPDRSRCESQGRQGVREVQCVCGGDGGGRCRLAGREEDTELVRCWAVGDTGQVGCRAGGRLGQAGRQAGRQARGRAEEKATTLTRHAARLRAD